LYRSKEAVTGRVISLHVRTEKHGAPLPVAEVVGRVGGGLEGDIHAHRSSRAVLVIDRATLDALRLASGDLREEITIEGLPDVTNLPVDAELRIGGVTLRVNGPCEPCTHIGELLGVPDREQFRQSLLGRRGALCTVSAATGPIRVGDPVEVLVRI
jgi:MOSC domain-containing protein YiiM